MNRLLRSPRPLALLTVPALAAVGLGAWTADGSTPGSPYLLQLHMHGSLSEGSGTMANHIRQAELHGYDGIWWTDHAGRQNPSWYQHRVPFDGDLLGRIEHEIDLPQPRFEPRLPPGASISYQPALPWTERQAIRLRFETSPGDPWRSARLDYRADADWLSKSLLAEPHLLLDLKHEAGGTSTGIIIELTFSSQPDGVTKDGIPRILEVEVGQGTLPPPRQGARRQKLGLGRMGEWNRLDLDLRAMAAAEWSLVPDLALRGVSLRFLARDGDTLSVQLDEFQVRAEGPLGAALFMEQRGHLVRNYRHHPVRQYLGMEVGGPYEQEILVYSSRDHILALLPDTVEEIPEFEPGSSIAQDYPASGVRWIQEQGGVAILAHVFGAPGEDQGLGVPHPGYLADRVVGARAWGADGMEVGYPSRAMPLADHVRVWDSLSEARTYLTGVGTSDNHSVIPWDLKINRWGTWVRADSLEESDLLPAVKGGAVFFGDPHVFAADGDLEFREAQDAYEMGDVVPTAGGTEQLEVAVDGARAGDELVLLRNAVEVARWPFTAAALQVTVSQAVQAGDWLRVEVRDAQDAPYLFSNPIYYIEAGATPPDHRRPGG